LLAAEVMSRGPRGPTAAANLRPYEVRLAERVSAAKFSSNGVAGAGACRHRGEILAAHKMLKPRIILADNMVVDHWFLHADVSRPLETVVEQTRPVCENDCVMAESMKRDLKTKSKDLEMQEEAGAAECFLGCDVRSDIFGRHCEITVRGALQPQKTSARPCSSAFQGFAFWVLRSCFLLVSRIVLLLR